MSRLNTVGNTASSSIGRQPTAAKGLRKAFASVMARIIEVIMNALEFLFAPIQRLVGVNNMAYVFLIPNLLIFGVFVLFPMLLNIYYSTTGRVEGTAGLFPNERQFTGMQNYAYLFECGNFLDPNTCRADLFWRGAYNTIFFVVFQVGFMVFFALITALALNYKIVARGFFRSVFFYPVLLSPVVVALIWKWILQREGLLNAIIESFGGEKILFLLDPNWATFWVIFVSVWAQMGFYTLILLAGLQSIPGELYEAGQIDGANKWQSFWGITFPLLMPTMFVVLVLALIRAVQVFDQVFVLTGGGPGTATQYMVQYIYNTGFSNQVQIRGVAAAASVVLGAVLLVFTLLQLWLGRRNEAA